MELADADVEISHRVAALLWEQVVATAGAYIDLEAFATQPALLLIVDRHALTEDWFVFGIYHRHFHIACRETISSPLFAECSLEVAFDKFESCALCAIVLTAKQDALLLALALECLSLLGCVEGIGSSLLCSLDLCLFEILLELLDAELQLKLFPLGSLIAELACLAELVDVYELVALNLGNLVAEVVNRN